jgi:heme-degrading monooxygenase HmoA
VIARVWNGTTVSGNADAYVSHLRDHTFPGLSSIPGHRGAYVLERTRGQIVDFTVITLWESLEAIRRFAGDEDPEKAVVPPAAHALLASYDARAVHWDVVLP